MSPTHTFAEYRICSNCVMDTTDPDIFFDEAGVCNHCHKYKKNVEQKLFTGPEQEAALRELVKNVKADGKGKKYDCVIGVSGGVDSTYVAYLVKKKLGLNPLAVHLDNGWNSELAVKNIENTLKKLDIDLYTYVIDWEEFKDIQLAFLEASTPDSEIPTDHAIVATLLKVATDYNLKYVLNGVNVKTEGIMPLKWGYGYFDYKYIKNLHNLFGHRKIKSFPHFNIVKLAYYLGLRKIKFVPILNYVNYDKQETMRVIQDELGWVYYGGKHYESIYTRFFQSYILPRKFNIDKRRSHLSNLVCSGQLTREQALEELKKETYPADKLAEDKEYVIKKFGITEAEFERIMNLPLKTFLEYKTNYFLFEKLKLIKNYLK